VQGAQGPKGDQGAKGADFNVDTRLPSGRTLSGSWGVGGGGTNSWMVDNVQFRIPLAAPIPDANAHFLDVAAPFTAACPGPGQAAPGNLCVYGQEGDGSYTYTSIYYEAPTESVSGADTTGFLIYLKAHADHTYVSGTWTVTAP
jgi:hypothetical protein